MSATARRHGISRALLTSWRRAYLAGGRGRETPEFFPVTVTPSPPAAAPMAAPASSATGRMEIVLANGRRIVVGADVDALALARIASALERG